MKWASLLLAATLVVAGCAAKPVLETRAAGSPPGVNLSGTWILRGADNTPIVERQTIIMPRTSARSAEMRERQRRSDGRTKGLSVHVFMESGKKLKVTQTDFGVFASFDRAIVEEVNFGENRIVTVGPIKAQRVTGWEGDALIIETMDEEGNVLKESWYLDDRGDVLVRDILIHKGDVEHMSIQQVFDRG